MEKNERKVYDYVRESGLYENREFKEDMKKIGGNALMKVAYALAGALVSVICGKK